MFVGGAVTHRLISDPAAPHPTATTDVDVVVDIASRATYLTELREALLQVGARQDTSEDAPVCRWILDSVQVDVMPVTEQVLGFGNRWHAGALRRATSVVVADKHEILMVDAPHFLATKAQAFMDRGGGNPLRSKDVEDVIAVVDGRPEIVSEVAQSPEALRGFLAEVFTTWRDSPAFGYAVEGYLRGEDERVDVVLRRFETLTRQ